MREGTLQRRQVNLGFSSGDRLRFVGNIVVVDVRETERQKMEQMEEVFVVNIVH